MRTSHPLSILAVTTALATTGWAVPAAAQDAGVDAVDDSATIIVTGTRRPDRTVADSAVPIAGISADTLDTKRVVWGKRGAVRVIPGRRRIMKKKKIKHKINIPTNEKI